MGEARQGGRDQIRPRSLNPHPSAEGLVVRVLPDEPAIDREFDYLITPHLLDRHPDVGPGWVVRIPLRGRRTRAWITGVGVEPPEGVDLSEVTRISGHGPPPAVLELAAWASERWVGPRPRFLRTATAPRNISRIERARAVTPSTGVESSLIREALDHPLSVVRTPPSISDTEIVRTALSRGRGLVLVPSLDRARALRRDLARSGTPLALYPDDWALSAGGLSTVGARSAAWAPVGDLDVVVVVDEHDEAYQEESAPTWNARDVAIHRALTGGVPCVLTSPVPSLESLHTARPILPSRGEERRGWPVLEVIDRRGDDPRTGQWCSPRLARIVTSDRKVACVINRKGRARILVCAGCGELATDGHGRPLAQEGEDLVSPVDGSRRPVVCEHCGSTRFRRSRIGVSGVVAELEALAGRPVVEITAETTEIPPSGLYVGTEALLHRLHPSDGVDVVVFLDIDQELLAPRYRAGEETMALVARAARLVGPREGGGRVAVQTRIPRHPVLDALLHADPGRFATSEMALRTELALPPAVALAMISGAAAPEFMARLGSPAGVTVMGPDEGRWLVKAPDHHTLSGALLAVRRPSGRLRIAVDPLRA